MFNQDIQHLLQMFVASAWNNNMMQMMQQGSNSTVECSQALAAYAEWMVTEGYWAWVPASSAGPSGEVCDCRTFHNQRVQFWTLELISHQNERL